MSTSTSQTRQEKPPADTRIGTVIRKAREAARPRISQAMLGEMVGGLSRSAVNLWECHKTVPKDRLLPTLSRVLGVDLSSYQQHETLAALDSHAGMKLGDPRFLAQNETRRVPVLHTTPNLNGARHGDFLLGQDVVDSVSLPTRLAARTDVRAIRVHGDHMEPRYFPNEMLFVGTIKQPVPGDFVLVVLKGTVAGTDLQPAMVRRLVSRTGDKLKLEQFKPPRTVTLDVKDTQSIERVMPLDELL